MAIQYSTTIACVIVYAVAQLIILTTNQKHSKYNKFVSQPKFMTCISQQQLYRRSISPAAYFPVFHLWSLLVQK